jgi:hypothetical protein
VSQGFKEYILNLISDEIEAFSAYERLCGRYQIPPNPIVKIVSANKISLLKDLIAHMND